MADSTTPEPAGLRYFPTATKRNLSFTELADAYMAQYAGRDHVRATYVAHWVAVFGDRPLSEIDADLVADAVDQLAATPARRYLGRDPDTGQVRNKELGLPRPSTLNRYKCPLSAMFSWAKQRRLLARGAPNPCRDIPNLPERNARTRFLSKDELARLLAATKVAAWPRLRLLVLMAVTTGARRSELLGLRYRDLDLDAGTAHVHATKNGDQRVLPLTAAVVAEIRRFGRAPSPDVLLFASKYNADKPMVIDMSFARALVDAAIVDFRFHDLRHSCASYLAQSGASLVQIADVLGHKSLDATRRYSHLTVDHKLVHNVLGHIGLEAA